MGNIFKKKKSSGVEQIQKDLTNSKNFKYLKDGLSLDFGLKTNNTKDLKTFIEILDEAKKDILEEIKFIELKEKNERNSN